jgi:hypothetical protein
LPFVWLLAPLYKQNLKLQQQQQQQEQPHQQMQQELKGFLSTMSTAEADS